MRELWSEVSGHHLLLCHWVSERALIMAMQVLVKPWGPACQGGWSSSDDRESDGELDNGGESSINQ